MIQDYEIRLSIQRALLDKITSNLRQINYLFENDDIKLYFFYDDKPSEEEKELAGDVSAELIADFLGPYRIEVEFIEVKHPTKIKSKGRAIYSRFEGF